MRTLFIKTFIIAAGILVTAASASSQTLLDNYISEGLKNNLVLQQKKIGLDKALHALKIANGMFAPTVALQGNYTSGTGGRSISIPVGDMLNPVYSTLNQLTDSEQFPQIENVDQNFFPNNFYDVKVRTSVPIINSDLIYNKKIRQQQTVLQEFETEIYKRELVKNIKVAYFNYLSAKEAINIYESALNRALESKRVNESLVSNGKGLQAYVLRSESEIEIIRAQITDAQNQSQNAKLYFNFLLNQVSDESIDETYDATPELLTVNELLTSEPALQQREEAKQVRESISLQKSILKMNRLYWSPKLSGFADVGSQAEDWKVSSESKYLLFGFQLDIPLFAGFTNRSKVSQARLDLKNSELNSSLVHQQINMSSQIAKNSLKTSYRSYQSSLKQLEAAQSYQRLIEKGYKEGVNTFIESIDARNQLTAAQLQVTINQYRVLSARAGHERETASYPLNNQN
jgi:outer membrane protein TolC